jgi:hypothetical protein
MCEADGKLLCDSENLCVPAYDWTQWSGSPPETSPTNYVINGDGTATDTVTGLVWQQDTPTETFAWSSTGASSSAQAYCAALNLGGHNGWRLPSIVELWSIVDLSGSDPTINGTVFPATTENYYWAATPYEATAGDAWTVVFDFAFVQAQVQTMAYNFRCVYSGGYDYVPGPHGAPSGRYTYPDGTAAASETVHDVVSGLTWQRGSAPATMTAPPAETYCASLSLGGFSSGWRLPTTKELMTLVDAAVSQPAIDTTVFPEATENAYWTSTPYTGSLMTFPPTQGYWVIDFYDGSPYGPYVIISGTADVRCVR